MNVRFIASIENQNQNHEKKFTLLDRFCFNRALSYLPTAMANPLMLKTAFWACGALILKGAG